FEGDAGSRGSGAALWTSRGGSRGPIWSAVASAMIPVVMAAGATGAVERSAQIYAGNDADGRSAICRRRAGAADAVPVEAQGARRSVGEAGAGCGRICLHVRRRAGERRRSGGSRGAGSGDGSCV